MDQHLQGEVPATDRGRVNFGRLRELLIAAWCLHCFQAPLTPDGVCACDPDVLKKAIRTASETIRIRKPRKADKNKGRGKDKE